MNWICLISKLNNPLTISLNFDVLKRTLKKYIEEHKFLADDFLNLTFHWISVLDFNDQEALKILKPEEVVKIDCQWNDFLSPESLFKLII
jgi:hypothetical protein